MTDQWPAYRTLQDMVMTLISSHNKNIILLANSGIKRKAQGRYIAEIHN